MSGTGKKTGESTSGDAVKGKASKDWSEIPCKLKPGDLDSLVQSQGFLPEYGCRLPATGETAAAPPAGYITLYSHFFTHCNLRIPMTRFVGALLQFYGIHISQVHPLGLVRVTHFEFACKSQGQDPTPRRFQYFYKPKVQDSWFSFAPRRAKVKCSTTSFKSLHDWSEKFFFIKAGVIPIRMTKRAITSVPADEGVFKKPIGAWVQKLTAEPSPAKNICEEALVAVGMSQRWANREAEPIIFVEGLGKHPQMS